MTEYKVYKIINDDMPGLVYYGSTKQTLKLRLNQHKYQVQKQSYKFKSSKLFEIGEPKMIQLDVFDNELDMYKKERKYIENNECLNVALPCIIKKDYSKGKIYKIVNNDFPDLVYYGSTIQNIKKRFVDHKNFKCCASKKLFETDNARTELVEDYPCETKRELETREKYYILNFECLNIKTPAPTIEERKEQIIKSRKKHRNTENFKINQHIYNQIHKEKHKQNTIEWRQKNPEKYKEQTKKHYQNIKEKNKIKYLCDCGSTIIVRCKTQHERTIKHKNYLDTL
tara:strand:- start:60 stop:911 length:852 start_codon:yes stop_codon:yes gene_type:complete